MSNAEPFYIYRPTKPIGAIDVREDSLPWVYDQDPSSGFCARMLVVPADALAAADKRIAEEREQHDIMMERGAEKLAEAERKLAVALDALRDIRNYATSEAYMSVIDAAGTAIVQIGGEDGN